MHAFSLGIHSHIASCAGVKFISANPVIFLRRQFLLQYLVLKLVMENYISQGKQKGNNGVNQAPGIKFDKGQHQKEKEQTAGEENLPISFMSTYQKFTVGCRQKP